MWAGAAGRRVFRQLQADWCQASLQAVAVLVGDSTSLLSLGIRGRNTTVLSSS